MPSAADFENLPIAEKVQLVTLIWDQIVKSGEPLTLPDSAIAEAERRLDDLLADPTQGISEDEMWQQADAHRN